MVAGLLVLLGFQLVGEVAVRLSGLPMPGPVVGLLALLVALSVGERSVAVVRPAADGLLRVLSLLFVPAGVGVVQYLTLIEPALLNPVLVSIGLVGAVLAGSGISYRTYFDGAQFVHFLLGPATVALAVPLHRHFAEIRRVAPVILGALVVGSAMAICSAIGLASLLGGTEQTVVSLAPKSATAPVAMSLSEEFGGRPSLTAVLTVLTGITGAVAGTWLLHLLRVSDERARGSRSGSRRTASPPLGRSRSARPPARSPGSASPSTRWRLRSSSPLAIWTVT